MILLLELIPYTGTQVNKHYAYFQNCKEIYVLNTQYALNYERQKLATLPKPRRLFSSTCT